MNDDKKILIATGGTGGHVFPAYSLGKFFQKKNVETVISTDLKGCERLVVVIINLSIYIPLYLSNVV